MSATFKPSQLIAVLVGALALAAASSSHAQYQQRRYEPSRPTVSPYLNLFRFNNSVIPNYQSLVRPEQQAQRFRQQQLQLDRQQQQELQRLQSNVRVLQQPRSQFRIGSTDRQRKLVQRAGRLTVRRHPRVFFQGRRRRLSGCATLAYTTFAPAPELTVHCAPFACWSSGLMRMLRTCTRLPGS